MGKRRVVSPAPAVIAEGSSAWHEYTVRREFADGRVADSEPMSEGSAAVAGAFAVFSRPPAVRVSVRRRLVSVFASSWEEVPAPDADGGEDGGVSPEHRRELTPEDLPSPSSPVPSGFITTVEELDPKAAYWAGGLGVRATTTATIVDEVDRVGDQP